MPLPSSDIAAMPVPTDLRSAVACLLLLPVAAQAENLVTEVFSDEVSVFSAKPAPLGKIPGKALLGQRVLGVEPATGLLIVATQNGPVYIKRAAVRTSEPPPAPPKPPCVQIGAPSLD